MPEMPKFRAEDVETFLTRLYKAGGMNDDDASWSASCMTLTNLWGVDSHGVLRAPIYSTRLHNGAVKAAPDIRTVAGGPDKALEVIDGGAGIG